nr:hypothetical protein [Tanacetum cinerariifolium]
MPTSLGSVPSQAPRSRSAHTGTRPKAPMLAATAFGLKGSAQFSDKTRPGRPYQSARRQRVPSARTYLARALDTIGESTQTYAGPRPQPTRRTSVAGGGLLAAAPASAQSAPAHAGGGGKPRPKPGPTRAPADASAAETQPQPTYP